MHSVSGRRRRTDPLPIPPSAIAIAIHLVLARSNSGTAGVQLEVLVPESLGRVGGVDVRYMNE